jgi:DNA-binding SARP family transcriptional activator
MIRAVAKRCVRSDAGLVIVTAPRGFNKTELSREILVADPRALLIDLSDVRVEEDLDRAIVGRLIQPLPVGTTGTSSGKRTVLFQHPEPFLGNASPAPLIAWIHRLLPFARVVFVSRVVPEDVATAMADRGVLRFDSADLAFHADPIQLARIGITAAVRREILDEFGHWPAAWHAYIRARQDGDDRLSDAMLDTLADMFDEEVEEIDTGREAVLGLAVLGRATLDEISAVSGSNDVAHALERLMGYAVEITDGYCTMPSFFRMRLFARYPAETATLVTRAITRASDRDPLRALVIALERDDHVAAQTVLERLSRSERDRLMAEASDIIGIEVFLGNDELFLNWYRAPRPHKKTVWIMERLLTLRESPVPDIRARRDLAIALFSVQSHRVSSMTHRLAALLERTELSPRLRSLARAKLAWLHAWEGDGEAFERLAPTLDHEHPDSIYALERHKFVQSIASHEERSALLEARLAVARGHADFERGTATYILIDGFFSDDDRQFQAGMQTLRDLAPNDAALAHALAYIDGHEHHLDFGSHPRFRSFAILVRASLEADPAKRLLLLRAAVAHADESLEIEIRIASRIALAYAAPREAASALAEAAGLARRIRSTPYAQAIVFAERLVVDGCLAGLARRFAATSEQPRVRLGILDGTIAGPDGAAIPIAQRQFELMAFLALHENSSADREAIIEAIWHELEPAAAAHALKTAAHRIRTALDDTGAIVLTPAGYRLPQSIETDVERLETILATIDEADVTARLGGLPLAYRTFTVAVERVREGIVRWAWAEPYIPRLDALLRRLANVIAARAIVTNRQEYAHRIVADLRTLDEADETSYIIAIRAYLAVGNQIAARREYDRYAEILNGFGAVPSHELADLFTNPVRAASS